MADPKLDYFKKKVIAILKQKEGEEPVTPEVKKSLDAMDYVYGLANPETMGSIEKAYGVGTVRIWKGKKYKKVSQNPTKWVRIYDKVDRGAKSSITRLINKADSCQSIDQLLQFCMSNHALFKDANGVDLPILDELRKAVKEKQTRLENGDTSSIRPQKKTPAKKEEKKESEAEKQNDEMINSLNDYIKDKYKDPKLLVRKEKRDVKVNHYSSEGLTILTENMDVISVYSNNIFIGYIIPGDKMWNEESLDNVIYIAEEKGEYGIDGKSEKELREKISKKKEEKKNIQDFIKELEEKIVKDKLFTIDDVKIIRVEKRGFIKKEDDSDLDLRQSYTDFIKKMGLPIVYDDYGNGVDVEWIATTEDNIKDLESLTNKGVKIYKESKDNFDKNNNYTTYDSLVEKGYSKLSQKMKDLGKITEYEAKKIKDKIESYKKDINNINTVLEKINSKLDNKESEAEKHQNRSDAMKGNKNAYKGGPKEEPKEPETPKTDDLEETKKQMKKVEDLFETYIKGHDHGVGYWLRNKGADAHHKAFCRATGIPYLVQAKAALEKEGYTMPEIPQKILDKFEEYKKAREGVSSWSSAGESILSGIRQTEFDAIVEAFKKPLQDKYKELKDKLPKVEAGSPKNNPPVAGKTNEEHAALFDTMKNDEGDTILTYNGKPYSRITGYGNLGKQQEMVQAAGMDPEAQIEYVKNKYNWNTYWTGIDSSLRKYGEKKIKELASTPVTSDEEFYSKLADACKEKYRDYGYIHNAIENHEYNKKIVEKAKKIAAKYDNNNSAIGDVDLPVDPKDRDEAISIIGDDVSYILGSGQWSNTTKATLKDKIIRRVRNKPGVARAMLVYIKEEQARTGKTVFTPKNEIWDYLPKLNENAMNALMSGTEETDKSTSGNLYTGDGISSVVEDKEAGRYQVYFTGKPDYDTRTILKQNGFRWTPSIGAWQCYNTSHGQRSLERVAEELGWNKE